ncbi:hypothetical protein AHF37_00668, partial [Paragonimus kellicotti]
FTSILPHLGFSCHICALVSIVESLEWRIPNTRQMDRWCKYEKTHVIRRTSCAKTSYPPLFQVLCFLSPITVLLLVAVVVTFGLDYANSTGQLRNFLTRFYTGFSTRIPVEQYARDQFQIQPLFWVSGFDVYLQVT